MSRQFCTPHNSRSARIRCPKEGDPAGRGSVWARSPRRAAPAPSIALTPGSNCKTKSIQITSARRCADAPRVKIKDAMQAISYKGTPSENDCTLRPSKDRSKITPKRSSDAINTNIPSTRKKPSKTEPTCWCTGASNQSTGTTGGPLHTALIFKARGLGRRLVLAPIARPL